jgi:hypothetical protein
MRLGGRLIIMSERQRIVAYVCAAGAVLLSVCVLLSKTIVRSGSVTSRMIENEESLLSRNARLYAQRDRLKLIHERAKPFFVVDEKDDKKVYASMLRTIEDLAREYRLSVTNVTPEAAPQNANAARVYRLAFRAEGSADDVSDFLRLTPFRSRRSMPPESCVSTGSSRCIT